MPPTSTQVPSLIHYPGPGWLVVFAGLAILGTEFAWAKRLLDSPLGPLT